MKIDTTHLRTMIHNGLLMASKDDTLPTLGAINFAADGDKLAASSTNRYMLQRTLAEVDGPLFEGSFLLSARHAAILDSVLRLRYNGAPAFNLTEILLGGVDGARKATFSTTAGLSVTFPSVEFSGGNYPDLKKLAHRGDQPVHTAAAKEEIKGYSTSLNPEFLRRVASLKPIAGYNIPIDFYRNPFHATAKKIPFTLGEHVEGAIMPVRSSGDW